MTFAETHPFGLQSELLRISHEQFRSRRIIRGSAAFSEKKGSISRFGGSGMTPFRRVPRDATASMIERTAMLAQPCEFFKAFFNGRTPSIAEKAFFVEEAVQRMTSVHIYQNDVYQVEVKHAPPFIHLDIRRRDGRVCSEWYEFQRIKNELVGPEYEALQLFPAESRLVDTGNEYHLWVHADPSVRFQFGFKDRFVLNEETQILMGTRASDCAQAMQSAGH